jgi:putative DNA primase/helicase
MISENLIQYLTSQELFVFPVQPNKKPYSKTKGWKDATNNPVEAIALFEKRPDALIAIATESSHLIVFDVDNHPDELDDDGNPKDGLKSYKEFRAAHGDFPPTWVVNTPSGGFHYYFTTSRIFKRAIGKLAPGIDLLSKGSYVVAPSETDSCQYQFAPGCSWYDIDQPAPCPQWILDWLEENKKPTNVPKTSQNQSGVGQTTNAADIIPEGQRNETLHRTACSLRAKGLDYNQILGAIFVMNEQQCQPPLEDAEVFCLVESACKHEPGASMDRKKAGRPKKDVAALEAQLAAFGIEDLNDTGNARRLVQNFGDVIRYCYGMKDWLVWDGTRWRIDNSGQMERFIKATAERIRDEATCFDEKSAACQAILAHASKSLEQHKIRAAKDNAASEAAIGIEREALDADPFLLNVANGTIDLRTGELLPHFKGNFITQMAHVSYDPEASYPEWMAFLLEIMDGDEELVEYLQRVVGYALTGDISEQCVFICYGRGANGKSTFIETIHALFGDYSQSTKFSTFTEKGDHALAILAGFEKTRLVTASETRAEAALAEDLIKEITGGEAITAKALYKMPFTYHPQFKLILSANHRPPIRHQDHGTWRRIRLIPFEVTIPKHQQRRDLPDVLRDELPGILTWAVQGCLAWQQGRQDGGDGLKTPEVVLHATEEYKNDMDTIADFLRDKFVLDASYKVEQKRVFPMYQEWNQANGNRYTMNKRNLNEALIERGFTLRPSNGKKWYVGLKPKMDVFKDLQETFRQQYPYQSN